MCWRLGLWLPSPTPRCYIGCELGPDSPCALPGVEGSSSCGGPLIEHFEEVAGGRTRRSEALIHGECSIAPSEFT